MAQEKSLYYKNLYGDFSDHTNPGDCYLEIKNRIRVCYLVSLFKFMVYVLSLFWTCQGDSSERTTAEIKLAGGLKRPKMLRTHRQGKKFSGCLVLLLFLSPKYSLLHSRF